MGFGTREEVETSGEIDNSSRRNLGENRLPYEIAFGVALVLQGCLMPKNAVGRKAVVPLSKAVLLDSSEDPNISGNVALRYLCLVGISLVSL